MKIPVHALALLVLLDSTVTLGAAKKHRHHKAAAAAQRTLQDGDAAPEIIVDDFDAVAPATLDCVQCSNIPTKHMLLTNKTCATYSYAWQRRCGTEYGWWGRDGQPEHCQYSCWVNGAPYATQGGAPCCERDDGNDDVGGDSVSASTATVTAPTTTAAATTTAGATENTTDTTTTADADADADADAAVDIEENDNEMAAILSEIQAEIAEVQEVIDLESTGAAPSPNEDDISTRPAAEDDEDEELDLFGSVIDLGVPVTEDGQNITGVDIGGDVPDVSDEFLKEIAAEELAIVEEVVDELEAEKSETTMTPTTIEPTMHPTTAHPTLISMTTFDIVDGKVIIFTPPPIDAPVAAPVAAPAAAPVVETTETDSKEGEPHPYVWLAPTHEPTITFSPTTHHVWLAPTPFPSEEPTMSPTPVPTEEPTANPTPVPSGSPTDMPVTSSPTPGPSSEPTMVHSRAPSAHPTPAPTGTPSSKPSPSPTASPSAAPTADPTSSPSAAPTRTASASPSEVPSSSPTHSPSEVPRYVCMRFGCDNAK